MVSFSKLGDSTQADIKSMCVGAANGAIGYIKDILAKLLEGFRLPSGVMVINTLAGLIINVISSIYILRTNSSFTMKAVATAGLVVIATTLVDAVGQVCESYSLGFDKQSAMEACTQTLSSMDDPTCNTPNSSGSDWMQYLSVAITAVVGVLAAGLIGCKIFTTKQFTEFARGITSVRTLGTDISKATNTLLGMFVDECVDPVIKIMEELQKRIQVWSELSTEPTYLLTRDVRKYKEIENAISEMNKIVSSPMYSDNRFGSSKVRIMQIIKTMEEKIKTAKEAGVTSMRQETLAVMLSGQEGIGKSSFVSWIARKYADLTGASADVYEIDKSVNFRPTYCGQVVAVKNEMFAVKGKEDFLLEFNRIASADPYNIEGARVDDKTNPCALEMLFCTTNPVNPDPSVVLVDSAIPAFWDRIFHLHVIDELSEGRQGENNHRKPDFSHLKFKLIEHPRGDKTDKIHYCTDLLGDERVFSAAEVADAIIRSTLVKKEAYLKRMATIIEMPDTEITKVRTMINKLTAFPLGVNATSKNQEIAEKPNEENAGNDFFMIRLQGSAGCGKTQLAEATLANHLSKIYGLDVQLSRTLSEFLPDTEKAKIYILDDWLDKTMTPDKANEYVSKINSTNRNSIFIITTNYVLQRESVLWNKADYLFATMARDSFVAPFSMGVYNKIHDGLARRLGLEGKVRDSSSSIIYLPQYVAQTYTTTQLGKFIGTGGLEYSANTILDRTGEYYDEFISRSGTFIIKKDRPVAVDSVIDVKITSDSLDDLLSTLQSKTSLFQLYMGKIEHTKLEVSQRFLDANRTFSPSDFMCDLTNVKGETNSERLFSVVSRMALVFTRQFPNSVFYASLATGETAYVKRGVLYFYNRDLQLGSFQDKKLFYTGRSQFRYVITPEDLAWAMAANVKTPLVDRMVGSIKCMSHVEYSEVLEIYEEATLNPTPENADFVSCCEVMKAKLTARQSIEWEKLYVEVAKHPVIWLMFGLLAMGTAAGIAYGLYTLVKELYEPEPNEANAYWGADTPATGQSQKKQRKYNAQETFINSKQTPNAYWGSDTPATGQSQKKQRKYNAQETFINSNEPEPQTKVPEKEEPEEVSNVSTRDQWLIKYCVDTTGFERDWSGIHEHQCTTCRKWYSHIHAFTTHSHSELRWQCPYFDCEQYFKKADYRNRDNTPNVVKNISYASNFSESIPIFKPARESMTLLRVGKKARLTDIEVVNRAMTLAKIDLTSDMKQYLEGEITFAVLLSKLPPHLKDLCRGCCTANMKQVTDIELAGMRNEPNFLRPEDMIEQIVESPYLLFHKTIREFYVKIENTTSGENFAYHLRNGYFWTVGHAFQEVGMHCRIRHNGQKYGGKCIYVDRNKDEAIVYSYDLKHMKSGFKHLLKQDSDFTNTCGAYMRAGPTYEVVVGKIFPVKHTMWSDTSSYYKPNEYQLVVQSVGMITVGNFVRKGDCGFPLVVTSGGSCKIVGYHNAFNTSSNDLFFVYVAQDRIGMLLDKLIGSNVECNSSLECVSMSRIQFKNNEDVFTLPSTYVDSLAWSDPSPMFNDTVLNWQGYLPLFDIKQNYKIPVQTHSLQLENSCLTVPAAYTDKYVEDWSNIASDAFGRKDPGYTQILRIKNVEKNIDQEAFEHAISLVIEKNKTYYGEVNFLRDFVVINGSTEDGIAKVDVTTSAGPYLKTKYGLNDKRDIFERKMTNGVETLHWSTNPAGQAAKAYFHQVVALLLSDQPDSYVCAVVQDCLKVENIDKIKAVLGKVRVFNVKDYSQNAAEKKFFGFWMGLIVLHHLVAEYAIGQDPYKLSTVMQKDFDSLQGYLINTDFKNFDKSIAPELIRGFVKVFMGILSDKAPVPNRLVFEEKLFKFLSVTVHIYKGSAYLTEQGNNSGAYITSLLNCVVNDLLFTYSLVRQYKRKWGVYPLRAEIQKHYRAKYMGDDRTVKVSKALGLTVEHIIEDTKHFGMDITPTKTALEGEEAVEDKIDFCSRVFHWDKVKQMVWPALKKQSVQGLLYWFPSDNRDIVRDNLSVCLYEARLHNDRAYFESILRDASKVAKLYGVDPTELTYTNFDAVGARHEMVVTGRASIISQYARREDIDERDKLLLKKDFNIQKIDPHLYYSIKDEETVYEPDQLILGAAKVNAESQKMGCTIDGNPIGYVNELLQKLKIDTRLEIAERSTGTPDNPTWEVVVTFRGRHYSGEGSNKSLAKKTAYRDLASFLQTNVVANNNNADKIEEAKQAAESVGRKVTLHYVSLHTEGARAFANKRGIKEIILACRRNHQVDFESDDHFLAYEYKSGHYFLSPLFGHLSWAKVKAIYGYIPGVSCTDDAVFLDVEDNECAFKLEEEMKDLSGDEYECVEDHWLTKTPVNQSVSSTSNQPNSGVVVTKVGKKKLYPTTRDINKYVQRHTTYRSAGSLWTEILKRRYYFATTVNNIPNSGVVTAKSGEVSHESPQATLVDPGKTNNEPHVTATGDRRRPVVLNPIGAVNMLGSSGVVCDLKDVVYTQYIDADVEITFSDQDPAGKVLAAISIDPLGKYMNAYIKSYVKQHKNYGGPIMVQVTVVGNPTTSSLITTGWMDRDPGKTVAISELQMLASTTHNVCLPNVTEYVLLDARQSAFFRKSGEPVAADSPHLVIAINSKAQSGFSESKEVRIRIQTRLANENDPCGAFKVSHPQTPVIKIDATTGRITSLNY